MKKIKHYIPFLLILAIVLCVSFIGGIFFEKSYSDNRTRFFLGQDGTFYCYLAMQKKYSPSHFPEVDELFDTHLDINLYFFSKYLNSHPRDATPENYNLLKKAMELRKAHGRIRNREVDKNVINHEIINSPEEIDELVFETIKILEKKRGFQ